MILPRFNQKRESLFDPWNETREFEMETLINSLEKLSGNSMGNSMNDKDLRTREKKQKLTIKDSKN